MIEGISHNILEVENRLVYSCFDYFLITIVIGKLLKLSPAFPPLQTGQISRLFYNSQANALAKALLMGFSQVAKSKEVRENLIKGQKISKKYYKMFAGILVEGDLTIPPPFDGELLDSTGIVE